MTLIELLLTAVALSMDAFAVATCKGLSLRSMNWKRAGLIGLFFGGFQALMPLIGWLLGKQFERLITSVDHWVVFALLALIGGKMIYDALKPDDGESCPTEEKLSIREHRSAVVRNQHRRACRRHFTRIFAGADFAVRCGDRGYNLYAVRRRSGDRAEVRR